VDCVLFGVGVLGEYAGLAGFGFGVWLPTGAES